MLGEAKHPRIRLRINAEILRCAQDDLRRDLLSATYQEKEFSKKFSIRLLPLFIPGEHPVLASGIKPHALQIEPD
jgi:hypothetical protein